MMNKVIHVFKNKRLTNTGITFAFHFGKRTILSQAYCCEEAWAKRLESPILRKIKMDQYFIDTDKKFNTKNGVSGIDIDLFANNLQEDGQLEELEHLLYRFRKTKRSVEMMDSTTYATVRAFLKFKDYESLFRILQHQESYGVFPDLYTYNMLMDTFIKENMLKEATQVAILMMLQEDFSNEISCLLAMYSCQMFMKKHSLESLGSEKVSEENENEDEEEIPVRVPFLRNPFFDDHFHLTKPEHLIGKTIFLAGLQLGNSDLLGRTHHLLGLALYDKWEKAWKLMESLVKLDKGPTLISEGVQEFKKHMTTIPSDDLKNKFEDLLGKLEQSNKLEPGDLEHHLNLRLKDISALENKDMQSQKKLFLLWEQERELALKRQNLAIDKERRLEEIAKKKEYLFWKEKLLFFFENEDKILDEYEKAQEIAAKLKSTQIGIDTYVPPEIIKKPTPRLTIYQKLARVKKL